MSFKGNGNSAGPGGHRGRFIVIEGIDGCGKTTQLKLLKKRIASAGGYAFITSEPTGKASHTPTAAGSLLASVLKGKTKMSDSAIAALFLSDRVLHNTDSRFGIRRLLESGADVLCSRYYYSSLVYQGTPELFDWVLHANLGCPDILRPDLCVFLDLDPDTSSNRIARRHRAAEIYEQSAEMLREAREKYIRVFEKVREADPSQNIVLINACRTPDEIADEIFSLLPSAL